ncbi:beta-1,3-galactosyltransferase 2-like [Chelmon rostratus]|uniref:beta-1,3-galactosyltransferase 2-like n=1 Tax=Chelmon rostratus TaxID=109905 RepID=UPI001BE7D382|nr:beta-1,3-galactosyltransferase 2-like [Chelmon rostratus]
MGDKETGSGGNRLKRQLIDGSYRQKKPWSHCWFQVLLLLCVVLFILCYTLSNSSLSRWENYPLHEQYRRFFSQPNQDNQTPFYQAYATHRVKTNEILETAEIPNVPATAPSTIPVIIPPTVPPSGIQYHQAYARNYHFIMDNTEVCKTKSPFLVLMVPVAPNDVAARDAIRQTWGKDSKVQGEVVLTLFMLGSSRGADVGQVQEELKRENLQHRDLIQSDFMDTYLNLTIKTMVIMEWLVTRCPTAAYAMKIDSDMFLNIDNLLIMLQTPGIPKQRYLTGMLMWNRPVVRSKDSKWYVPEEMYSKPTYPTYTLGMGYVFSNDLPVKLVEVSKSVKPFNIEDAYIGVCMEKLGLAPTSPPNPSQFKAYSTKYDRCEYSKIITYILGSSEELVRYWTDLKKPGPPC